MFLFACPLLDFKYFWDEKKEVYLKVYMEVYRAKSRKCGTRLDLGIFSYFDKRCPKVC